jgi:hypothetical protein
MKRVCSYSCVSRSGAGIVGTYNYSYVTFNRDSLCNGVMRNIAAYVHDHNIPWDPFNIELIVKVKAQTEPKLPNSLSDFLK